MRPGFFLFAAAVAVALSGCASLPTGHALVGRCGFDVATYSFRSNAAAQAACLLRPVYHGGVLDQKPAALPEVLTARVGQPFDLPRAGLETEMRRYGLDAFIPTLGSPVSRANDNDPAAPLARYFIIHDTSEPNFHDAPFPTDMDTSAKVNDLSHYAGQNAVAHVFIARTGAILIGHDFSVPWRSTKLESRIIGTRAKGLFIAVETQTPRRADPLGPPGNGSLAPDPGFTARQYETLTLLYIVASARAGVWMIPAFHAAIDEGLPAAHDDPQNFSLPAFAAALQAHIAAINDVLAPR